MSDDPPKKILRTIGETGDYFARLEHVEVDFGKGKVKETYRAVIPDAALVLALTDKGKIPLVHHYRVFGRGWVYELPGGIMDKEELESPEITALRELEEETGLAAHKIKTLYKYQPISDVRCNVHLFFASDLKKGEPMRDETEHEMEVVEVTPGQLWAMVLDGTIQDSATTLAILIAKEKGLLKIDMKDVKKGHPF